MGRPNNKMKLIVNKELLLRTWKNLMIICANAVLCFPKRTKSFSVTLFTSWRIEIRMKLNEISLHVDKPKIMIKLKM